jgi:hypothetical protein
METPVEKRAEDLTGLSLRHLRGCGGEEAVPGVAPAPVRCGTDGRGVACVQQVVWSHVET